MNPLIGLMANQANSNNPTMQMLQKFGEFRKNWTPQSAQAKIDEMMRSGQISAQQYEQARQMAERFKGILK